MSFNALPNYTKEVLEQLNKNYSEILNRYSFYLAGGIKLLFKQLENKYKQMDLYHLVKSLASFKDTDKDPSPNLNMIQDIFWEKVKDYFTQELKFVIE